MCGEGFKKWCEDILSCCAENKPVKHIFWQVRGKHILYLVIDID